MNKPLTCWPLQSVEFPLSPVHVLSGSAVFLFFVSIVIKLSFSCSSIPMVLPLNYFPDLLEQPYNSSKEGIPIKKVKRLYQSCVNEGIHFFMHFQECYRYERSHGYSCFLKDLLPRAVATSVQHFLKPLQMIFATSAYWSAKK